MAFFKKMKHFLSLLLFITTINCFGQTMEVNISRDEVRVGDVFVLQYRISDISDFPETINENDFFPVNVLSKDTIVEQPDSLVEILSYRDSILMNNGISGYTRSYHLIAWDSCALSLVGFDYLYNDSVFTFPPVYLNVTYYDTEDGVELLDIQEDFHEWKKSTSKINKKLNLWWIWTLISILCLGIILYFLWLRSHKEKQMLRQSLQEITLEQIEKLKKEKLWHKDMLKEHFVQFSHILRAYLTNRFGISFLDKTTEQSILLLDQLELDEKIKNMILQLLKKSDLVKFADSRTEEKYIQILFEELTLIVYQTTPILEDS